MTEWVREVVKVNLDTTDPLQKEFGEHVAFVFNQVLQFIRKEGYTKKALEKIGKLLWRLYLVYMGYKTKSEELSQKQWLAKLAAVAKQLGSALSGGAPIRMLPGA